MNLEAEFDPNRTIRSWREALGQSSAFHTENLDELEAHLRDSIATLQTHGLSSEEAFMIASKRIGSGDLLGMEFSKVNRPGVWFDRMLWVLVWKMARRPKSLVRTFFCKLLKQPLALALSFLLLGLTMRLISTSSYVLIFSKPSAQFVAYGMKVPTTFPIAANVLVQLPQYALCAMLTVFAARKCLDLRRT